MGYTVQTLHFAVTIGPDNNVHCDIVGNLYLPADASPTNTVPAILATNGFGGSDADLAGEGKAFASDGYAFLAYTGLGFGSADGIPPAYTPTNGSTCQITLDDPDWDGKAGSQLISYLGGAPGIAYFDAAHTQPAPQLDVITHKALNHDGVAEPYDPVVGMIGGSYGGEIQFAVADQDPRLDTIVPQITWNDLNYSLDPNNTASVGGVETSTPGAAKLFWAAAFSLEGIADGIAGSTSDPTRLLPCPNFATWVCPALVQAATTGYVDPTSAADLRHASVVSYMQNIKIPTLLMQGENDTLFNLNEATATYNALKARHVPVWMIWQSWGHSHSTPAAGEYDPTNLTPGTSYETDRVMNWFAYWLKGDKTVDLGHKFVWFRNWVDYQGDAAPAYANSDADAIDSSQFYLGTNTISSSAPVIAGSQTFVTPAVGLPTSTNPTDVIDQVSTTLEVPEADAPGTYAEWNGASLASDLDVVGSPVLTLQVSDPAASLSQLTGPSGQLVLFVRLQDVAPDGTATDIQSSIAPIRVPDVNVPFTITMPGIVHQFAVGHHVRLIIAGGSTNYRGNITPSTVTITGGAGQTLTLPTTRY